MIRHTICRLILCLSVTSLGLLAATGARAADVLARYLASDVTAVASLDLEKFNILTAFEWCVELGIVPPEQIDGQRTSATNAQSAYGELPRLGARRLYILVRPSDIEFGGTSVVVEVKDGGDAQAVAKLVSSWLDAARTQNAFGSETKYLPRVVQAADGVVLAASSDEQLNLLTEAQPAPREDAAAALAALQAADAGVVAFGDADSRRVVREMFPQMPAPFMEIDGKLLADGVSWGGITVKLPPEPSVSATIVASTPAAATTLQEAAVKGVTLLKGLCLTMVAQGESEAATLLPMLGLLTPKADDLQVSLTIGDDQLEKSAIRDMLSPALRASREAARRTQRLNHFKRIGLAMFLYNDAKGSFPPAAIKNGQGKSLLSWRVAILPYIEQQDLYNQFHLDEPWDSDHNRSLIAKMPAIFGDPAQPELAAAGRTTFVVPVAEGTAFGGETGTKISEIKDGTSQTIMTVEVIPELAVIWTKPDDWQVDLGDPLRGVKRNADDGRGQVFTAGWCDGSVRMVATTIDSAAFKALLTIAGGEVVPPAP